MEYISFGSITHSVPIMDKSCHLILGWQIRSRLKNCSNQNLNVPESLPSQGKHECTTTLSISPLEMPSIQHALETLNPRKYSKNEILHKWNLNIPVSSLDQGESAGGLRIPTEAPQVSTFRGPKTLGAGKIMQKNESCQNWNLIVLEWSASQGDFTHAFNLSNAASKMPNVLP